MSNACHLSFLLSGTVQTALRKKNGWCCDSVPLGCDLWKKDETFNLSLPAVEAVPTQKQVACVSRDVI